MRLPAGRFHVRIEDLPGRRAPNICVVHPVAVARWRCVYYGLRAQPKSFLSSTNLRHGIVIHWKVYITLAEIHPGLLKAHWLSSSRLSLS